MNSRVIKILVAIVIVLEVVLTLKSMVVLKSLLTLPDMNNTVSLLDKIMVIGNLIFSFIAIIFLVVIIFSLISSFRRTSSGIDENIGKRKKNSKVENLSKEQILVTEIVEKLASDIDENLNINEFTEKVLGNIAEEYKIVQGLFFVKYPNTETYKKISTYAFFSEEEVKDFADNVGLSGQVAVSRKPLNISEIPENYLTVISGLGQTSPNNLLILPVVFNNQSIGVVELASFHKFDSTAEEVLMAFLSMVAEKLNNYYFPKLGSISNEVMNNE